MGTPLANRLHLISENLQRMAASDQFWELLQATFGPTYKTTAAIDLRRQWLKGDGSQLPAFKIVSAEELRGAYAGYSSRANVIVVSRSFLQTAHESVINRILLEEIGHFVDARIKDRDTPGDEGERFANAVLGIALSPDEHDRVARENDQAVLSLAGKELWVEKADPVILIVSTLADENDGSATLGAGLSLRDAILQANNNPATDFEIRLRGGQTYALRASGFHEDNSLKGDLDIKARTGSLKIVATGEGKASISAANLTTGDRVFDVLENANLSLENLSVSGGNCVGDGGGINVEKDASLAALNCEIKSNSTVSDGGAIHNSGTCRLERVNISANRAAGYSSDGGGIYNSGDLLLLNSSVSNNTGTGIYNFETIILIGSTISGNSQQGIYLNGASAGLVNTTISGNQKSGLSIFNSSVTITNCTITENSSNYDSDAGGIDSRNSAVFLRNSIIAGNLNTDDGVLDLSGEFNGNANNLIGSLAGASGTVGSGSDTVNPNPGLAALADNGGPTRTHALLAGSPALNGGDNTLVSLDDEDGDQDGDHTEMIPFDGRGAGYERIRWGVVDIGAFEAPIQPRGLPRISLSLSPESLAEDGTGAFLYTFTRTGSTANTLTIQYTISGTATAGVDYGQLAPPEAAIKTVTLAAGSNTTSVAITPNPDSSMEPNETVSLRLASSSTYSIATPGALTATLINDDFLGTASADVITGSIYGDTLDGLAGADVLTGGEGADRFRCRASQSALTAPDRITDFVLRTDKISLLDAGGKKLPLPLSASRAQDNGTASTLRQLSSAVFADANGALNGPQPLAANQAALVVATHPAIAGTYVLCNDSTAALSLSNDTLINISGSIGMLPAVGAFAPSLLFD